MSRYNTKNEQLVEEFHVQVYSNGRIDWDNLDSYMTRKELDPRSLLGRLKARLEPVVSH